MILGITLIFNSETKADVHHMLKHSPVRRKNDLIGSLESSLDAPLWLLQKDDSRFLYIALSLSVILHIILFAVMAATRIFHPFTGASQEFDLVWFSPPSVTSPMESSTPKPSVAKKENISSPATEAKPSPVAQVKAETQPPPPASNPPQAPPATAQVQASKDVPVEEPSEMVISRFDGKVVDVTDKKAVNPAFTVISSVKVKSAAARAKVQNIREDARKNLKTQQAKQKTKPAEESLVAALPKEGPAGKREKSFAGKATPTNRLNNEQSNSGEKPIQQKISTSAAVVAQKQPPSYPAVNQSINSLAAALDALSAAGSKLAQQEHAPQRQNNGAAGEEKLSSLRSPTEVKTSSQPPTVEKPAQPEIKQAPQPPPPPQLILHPPVTGDLKLVITGDVEVKVEVSFRPFPKNRRSKAFTRWEAEKRRSVLPKMVRTKEKVHEAVVEITEEGVYFIVVRPDSGKQGTAELVLKIRESRPGAATKNLGSRKIDGTFEVAKVLMPEGILWNDDSYFTGDMEDADSITKFHTGTGLMWREYK